MTDRDLKFAGSRTQPLAMQIEGSGRVILEDGTPLRINYDSHNGYSFTSLNRALIEHHRISREEISSQHIREWMTAHPDEKRATNRSYVFFRITGLSCPFLAVQGAITYRRGQVY